MADLPQNSLHRVFEKYRAMPSTRAARARANYAGKLTLIDERIGDILSAVEARDELSNTVIIFASDHGSMNGDLGLAHKRTFFNGSVRVPLIVRTPETARAGGGGRSTGTDSPSITTRSSTTSFGINVGQ